MLEGWRKNQSRLIPSLKWTFQSCPVLPSLPGGTPFRRRTCHSPHFKHLGEFCPLLRRKEPNCCGEREAGAGVGMNRIVLSQQSGSPLKFEARCRRPSPLGRQVHRGQTFKLSESSALLGRREVWTAHKSGFKGRSVKTWRPTGRENGGESCALHVL